MHGNLELRFMAAGMTFTNIKHSKFYWNKHVTYRQTHVYGHLQPCSGFHPICCACLLATELDIQDFLETEGNYCRTVIISAASGDTFAESGQYDMQPRVVGELGPVDCTKETVLVHLMAFQCQNLQQSTSLLPSLLNVLMYCAHTFMCLTGNNIFSNTQYYAVYMCTMEKLHAHSLLFVA